jgi:two-component system sensor histidine kinase KdpD
VFPDSKGAGLDRPHRELLETFARQTALALERAHFAEEARTAALRARTEEMRSSLLSAVSHDLRTPLAAITGAATTIRDSGERLSESQRAELLETICEEAARLERLVGNLLDMTKIEAGAVEPRVEWIPLEEIVGSALARVDRELAGHPISVEIPEPMSLAPVDPLLFEQVLVNLLENAAKHTPPKTPITVSAHKSKGRLVIEVADQGPGLPGDPSRLFQKFVRGSTSTNGAGLGLSIVRGIVEAHRGSIEAENRPGGGAVFRITIPVGEAPA